MSRALSMVEIFLFIAIFLTALLSAIFGMAGGLILMGVLVFFLPVSSAMVVHGIMQGISNGWRAILLRSYIHWTILGLYLAGSLIAALGLIAISLTLPKAWLFIVLGLIPIIVWIPKSIFRIDPCQPVSGVAMGLIVTGLNVIAGVSGPLVDSMMQNVPGDRRTIVATKAASQVAAHGVKIVYYLPAVLGSGLGLVPWFFVLAIPLSIAGTTLGSKVLDRMSDTTFRKATKYIVTGIGLIYVLRGGLLLAGGSG